MSYYDKKYIKGEHKKHECKEDCKKHEEKDDCKMEHHKHYEEEEKGLLTEFDVDQFPAVPVSSTAIPNLNDAIAEVEVCVDDRSDRVALDATIEWQPDSVSLVGLALGILLQILRTLGISIPLAVPATFRIWRKGSTGTVLISEKTDSSSLAGISILTPLSAAGAGLGVSILFSRITTSIHAVDTNPPLGENEYFLTIDLGPFNLVLTGLTPPADAALAPLSTIDIDRTNVISYTFTASEIEAN
ncbi:MULTISPECIES: hypothetical protein [Priestia]|uniref:hypothetical protein n=1 Tax=Priestia TaxID=2800373 RepID=UPI000ABA9B5A|nr:MULTISPECIES: hypothetical protein [Priestia]